MSYRENHKGTCEEIRASYPTAWQNAKVVDSRFAALKPCNVTSQFGEDGLLTGIFEIIGIKHKRCFEVGASDGVFFSNTKVLRDQGWEAMLVEADALDAEQLASFRSDKVKTLHASLTEEHGLDFFFGRATENNALYDLGVIDTDAGDFAFWAAMTEVRPRVVCIECSEDWGTRSGGQARLSALTALGKDKGYTLVAVTWCNALFVADEELPKTPDYKPVKILAVMSRPREGPLDTMDCILRCMTRHGIPYSSYPGPFWEMGLQNAMESALARDADILITFDYDSLFTEHDFDVMLHTFLQNEHMDALAALQPQRGTGILLFGLPGQTELAQKKILIGDVIKVDYAHFGLTFFRMKKFKNMPKPWLLNVPCADGSWMRDPKAEYDTQRVDSDMYFWRKAWAPAGNNIYVHTGVFLGHIERMVSIFHVYNDADGKQQGGVKYFNLREWLSKHPLMVEASTL